MLLKHRTQDKSDAENASIRLCKPIAISFCSLSLYPFLSHLWLLTKYLSFNIYFLPDGCMHTSFWFSSWVALSYLDIEFDHKKLHHKKKKKGKTQIGMESAYVANHQQKQNDILLKSKNVTPVYKWVRTSEFRLPSTCECLSNRSDLKRS